MSRAIVLLSGGIDSTTALAVAQRDGHDCYALSMDYGQTHRVELEAAHALADHYQLSAHRVVSVDLNQWGGSTLTTDSAESLFDSQEGSFSVPIVPSTYVPARNTVMLSLALSWADVIEAQMIYVGFNQDDYNDYPDCRPEFLEAFEHVARYGTRMGVSLSPVQVKAPLIHLSKVDVVRLAVSLDVPLGLTHSCYSPTGSKACGICNACLLRQEAFSMSGYTDPLNSLV